VINLVHHQFSAEELDDLQKRCEAAVQEHPDDCELEQLMLRLLVENRELREVLRVVTP
jgi:hypothetical protein